MRVLDLGCGSGLDLAAWGVIASDEVTGVDIDKSRLAAARLRFPKRAYQQCPGERLPFHAQSFDRVISSVALPYMNIQKTLSEVRRVLVPGGALSFSLHSPSFTFSELLHNAFPKPIPMLFRLYVMANGLWFHCTGRTAGFLRRRTESFQTERGMRIALHRAGFDNLSFSRRVASAGAASANKSFLVEANRSSECLPLAALTRGSYEDDMLGTHATSC
jgi:ubiquinone/menaquinone biosynthesis C-methylase UbiE